MVRSNEEKVEMILCYGEAGRSLHGAVRIFNDKFPDLSTDRKYMRKIVDRFTTSFTLEDAPRSGRPLTIDEDLEIDILSNFTANPHSTLRSNAPALGISKSSVHNVLKKHNFHPYKVILNQEIKEDDPDRRLQFCEEMLQKIDNNLNAISQICFSDEAAFTLHGTVNRHNSRYWSDANPHWMVEAHTQHPQKVNVWAGLLGDSVVGPFFIDGNLTGGKYLEMLQGNIVPAINGIVQNSFNPVFQHDGAPAHFDVRVRNFLQEQFPGRWIGRRGPTEWPARSPDLTPLDFFFWGFLKSKVYETRPRDLDDLRGKIQNTCRLITPEMLNNVRRSFENRLYFCQEVNGGLFEHLI